MLGSLKIPLKWGKHYTVYGGPFKEVPDHAYGVKMAGEIKKGCDVDIPTRDFDVPNARVLNEGLLKTLHALDKGYPVYVGCMAGKGRTGLFLSILSKVFGVAGPVEYVRSNYYSHAVETEDQYKFVAGYTPTMEVQALVKKLRLKSLFRFKKNLTTPL